MENIYTHIHIYNFRPYTKRVSPLIIFRSFVKIFFYFYFYKKRKFYFNVVKNKTEIQVKNIKNINEDLQMFSTVPYQKVFPFYPLRIILNYTYKSHTPFSYPQILSVNKKKQKKKRIYHLFLYLNKFHIYTIRH